MMLQPGSFPQCEPRLFLKLALEKMNAEKLGIVCIAEADGKLAGIFTDGDIRRMLLKDQKPFPALFTDDVIVHAVKKPTTVHPDDSLMQAIEVMEQKEIWDLPVVDENGALCGLLHLHPAIKALLGMA
ncbi:putative CBS domain protein [Magnetofaba australis IT-1]|uniref:Putative CBS domain protein n=2 Tax=Magnetofaba TaxID=1472292 RepID=A0A1Y2K5C3_9PROT|nr:putative CBS domain protein [Magnetofaba australis IT-1]